MKKLFGYLHIGIILLLLSSIGCFAQDNPVTWKVSSQQLEKDLYEIIFDAQIEGQWHLYDVGPYTNGPNATTFTFELPEGAQLEGGIEMISTPNKHYDQIFGMEIGYFEKSAKFRQKIKLTTEGAKINANVEWMACDDRSCLPPTDIDLSIILGNVSVATQKTEEIQTSTTDQVAATSITAVPHSGSGKSIWSFIIEAILWGFAALLTPCVFPMVPMTVSFFMKGSENKGQGKFKALMYGFFIVSLYTLPIAAIIIITKIVGGETVTADMFNWLATHWIPNVLFFLIFMIFAASFFGAFEIVLPSKMVNKSDKNVDKGGLVGIFFLALTLVLVSFSCTGPIVGSVLIKSTAGEFFTPIITMLAFSTAFALPFVLFAMFPSWLNKVPKSGGWLNSVKVILGFIEVALGLKFLSVADQVYHWGILDREVYLAIWIVVFTLLGLYLLGKIKFAHDSDLKFVSVGRLSLAIITFSFVVYLIPGMFGAPLKALSGYLPPIHTQDFVLGTNTASQSSAATEQRGKHSDFLHLPLGLTGFFDLKEAEEYAEKVGKPLFIDFTGHGCVNCREMEARVWSNPAVLEILKNDYVILALYVDDKKELPESDWITTDKGKVLKTLGRINSYIGLQKYGATAQPHYIIQGKGKKVLLPPRNYDLSIDGFIEFLKKGVEEYKKQ